MYACIVIEVLCDDSRRQSRWEKKGGHTHTEGVYVVQYIINDMFTVLLLVSGFSKVLLFCFVLFFVLLLRVSLFFLVF